MKKAVVYESVKEGRICLEKRESLVFRADDAQTEMKLLQVYRSVENQKTGGFGGAFTQAAAQTYFKMSQKKQEELMQLLFSENGLSYSCGRIPIGACDFSNGNYSLCDKEDEQLAGFGEGEDAKELFPFLRRVCENAKDIEFMASPWSPPAWMKSSGEMCHGGVLKEECYGAYARYLVKFIKLCKENGIKISLISTQNEPKAVQVWESCIYDSAAEKKFVKDFLLPELSAAGLSDVGVVIWDHNKERAYIRAREILSDKELFNKVKGIAFHWYSGDHFENLALCRRFFPDTELLFTEGCVELTATNTTMAQKAESAGRACVNDAPWEFGEFYAHDIIGNLNAGMNTFLDWNVILNEQGGPNHVGNYCSAPIICDTQNDVIYKQPSFTHIAHFSRFIPKGSRILATSRYTQGVEAVAAKTQNGTIVLVAMNPGEAPLDITISDADEKMLLDYTLKPHSIATFEWN